METPQTYKNHVRWFPLVHFVILPLLLLNFIWQAVRLYQEPGWNQAQAFLFALTVFLLALAARQQAVKAQDRIIRLEERLRYETLLPADMAAGASLLDHSKVIALRFASDEELPELVTLVLDGKLSKPKEIKMAVKNWRGDHLRV